MQWRWPRLGGQLGMLCIAAGIVMIVFGWNGAAGESEVDAQIPYLLSGGAAGLAVVGLGIALLVVENSRRDRAILEAQIRELSQSVTRLANAVADTAVADVGAPTSVFVAGTDSYHRPDCQLIAGKDLPRVTGGAVAAQGLTACRVCDPGPVTAGGSS